MVRPRFDVLDDKMAVAIRQPEIFPLIKDDMSIFDRLSRTIEDPSGKVCFIGIGACCMAQTEAG